MTRLEGTRGRLAAVVLATGERVRRGGLFFKTGHDQTSHLAADLGCRFTRKGHVLTDTLEGTHIDGLWVVGDASADVQLAMLAAADGVKAAFAINESFAAEETA